MNKLGALSTIAQTNIKYSGAIVFFHGSGDTGHGVKEWVRMAFGKDYNFPHLKMYFPTAPMKPYTPYDNEPSTVWFDREDIRPDVPEIKESIDETCKEMEIFIKTDVCKDLPINRIILGGFSMGGAFALHLATRYLPDVAGIFTISSFINNESLVYDKLKVNNLRKPILMCHGDRDSLVPIEWGQNTFEQLKKYGLDAEFHSIKYKMHELKRAELITLHEWILKVLPPLDTDK